jgi:hypothetical protein
MLQEQIAITNNVVKYEFALANLADSQTATDVPALGGVVPTYLLPFDGYVVGYAINKSAAHSAGSVDFDIEIDGTSTLTIAADTASVYGSLETPDEPFNAGTTLGVTYTTDENVEANTVDVIVSVFVVFTEVRF